jgi:hypothetical protein
MSTINKPIREHHGLVKFSRLSEQELSGKTNRIQLFPLPYLNFCSSAEGILYYAQVYETCVTPPTQHFENPVPDFLETSAAGRPGQTVFLFRHKNRFPAKNRTVVVGVGRGTTISLLPTTTQLTTTLLHSGMIE